MLDPPQLDLTSLGESVPAHALPDNMRILKSPKEFVYNFIGELTQSLMSDNTQIRDTSREALGAELSPRLYVRLFKLIEE